MNLFEQRGKPGVEQVNRVRQWATQVWAVSEDTTIMVTELECREPDCPPIETVIALLEGPGRRRQFKIHKTIAEIEESDVRRLAEGRDDHQEEHS